MLIEVRPTDKLRGRNGTVLTSVLSAILRAADEERLDLGRARVVCDWIQYKKNFREPVEVREIVDALAGVEIAVDLRRGSDDASALETALALALGRNGDAAAERLYLEPWAPGTRSCVWSFNALYWKALGLWE